MKDILQFTKYLVWQWYLCRWDGALPTGYGSNVLTRFRLSTQATQAKISEEELHEVAQAMKCIREQFPNHFCHMITYFNYGQQARPTARSLNISDGKLNRELDAVFAYASGLLHGSSLNNGYQN